MRKFMIAGAMVIGSGLAAYGQTTIVQEQYYVIQEPTTKRCTIVSERPTSSSSVVLDLGIFRTRTDAELGARQSKVCVYD
jgi:hypothetical protein